MNGDWTEVTVEEIAAKSPNALATGPFGSSISARFFQGSGVPVIRGNNLSENVEHRLLEDNLAFLSTEKAQEFERSKVRAGDLIFTCWGTIGQVGLIDKRTTYPEYVISNKQMKLTPDSNKADSLFLYYLFSSPEMFERVKNQAIGTSVPGFNLGQLRSLTLKLPPLSEQHTIATILGSLDDKIELNRRINVTLEGLARAIFQSWFVDFDPVRAKMEGRRPAGMDESTAALFPDHFEESELGEIPAGWKVEILGDFVEVIKGLSYKGEGLKSSGMPLHNLNSVLEGGGYKHRGIKYYDGDYKERHKVYPGDVIVANTEQGFDFLLIGFPAIVSKCYGNEGLFSHHLFRIRPLPDSPLTPHFIHRLLMVPQIREQVIGCTNGTTVNMLAIQGLQTPKFILPTANIIAAFDKIIVPLFEKIEVNYMENQSLAALRDALLPKLLSGEVRVGLE